MGVVLLGQVGSLVPARIGDTMVIAPSTATADSMRF